MISWSSKKSPYKIKSETDNIKKQDDDPESFSPNNFTI